MDSRRDYAYRYFFISCLHDYYEATKDMEVLRELWEVAYLQAKLALEELELMMWFMIVMIGGVS